MKHSTYLRMYDSYFNCILSRDDFTWGGVFIGLSNTGDRFFSTTNNSLYAYDIQGNLLWNTEFPDPDELWGFHFMSNRGLRSDGSGFWYFDGESIHSCLIEGM